MSRGVAMPLFNLNGIKVIKGLIQVVIVLPRLPDFPLCERVSRRNAWLKMLPFIIIIWTLASLPMLSAAAKKAAELEEVGSAIHQRQAGCNADNLLRALRNTARAATATPFCESYICSPSSTATATATGTGHPAWFYNLQPTFSGETPVTYASPPSPSTVPGGGGNYGCQELFGIASCWPNAERRRLVPTPAVGEPQQDNHIQRAADTTSCPSPPLPTFVATTYPPASISSACSCLLATAPLYTTTSTCTSIVTSLPVSTIPAFCQPTLLRNAPTLLSSLPLTTATASLGAVANKMDCCASCGDIFNCVAWSFKPSATTTPASPALPGGFDPWLPGTCVVVYNHDNTGTPQNYAICPNGQVGEVLNGTNNPDPNWAYDYGDTIHYNGWNDGPCGEENGEYNESNEGDFEYDTCY